MASCNEIGTSCTTGDSLIRAVNDDELNTPNSLDSCTDGNGGNHLSDESIESITVRSLSGHLQEGATVEISAVVWPWTNGFSQDTADFYFADNTNAPNWVLIGSVVPESTSYQTLTVQYKLPAGTMQAVRVNFRWRGSPNGACSGGNYDDVDDLAFAVASADVQQMTAGMISYPEPEPIKTPPKQVFTCDSLDRPRCATISSCRWNGNRLKRKNGGCQPKDHGNDGTSNIFGLGGF